VATNKYDKQATLAGYCTSTGKACTLNGKATVISDHVSRSALSNPRPSRRFYAAQFRSSL